jgi:hypothetical protein
VTDWTSGYVADIGYTFGYYQELNPLRARLAFLNKGLVCPNVGVACELGFGQGLSTNIHAAASTTQWYGTDFNPSQAGLAPELAAISGADVSLYADSFADFCNRSDLPDFDCISLHGVWSWISDENRQIIVNFISKKLKVGGLLYISYNTLPGWAAFAPMRHLMTQHAEIIGSEGSGIVNRIDGATSFAEKLLATNPTYLKANPLVSERLDILKGQPSQYLAHEYFNRDWLPMHFASTAQWLESAKVSYACSAHYMDDNESINLTPEQQEFLNTIPDKLLRESTRDFMVNQVFRRDYWIKGIRKLPNLEQLEGIRKESIILQTPRSEVALTVKDGGREINLNAEIYNPILDILADHKVVSLAELESKLNAEDISLAKIVQAAMVLADCGHLFVAQNKENLTEVKAQSDKLNAHIQQRARSNEEVRYLASPVTGGGIAISRFHQLFLLALQAGKKTPAGLAESAWAVLNDQGERLVENGKLVESEAENISKLTSQAEIFKEKGLPVLKALQIA